MSKRKKQKTATKLAGKDENIRTNEEARVRAEQQRLLDAYIKACDEHTAALRAHKTMFIQKGWTLPRLDRDLSAKMVAFDAAYTILEKHISKHGPLVDLTVLNL